MRPIFSLAGALVWSCGGADPADSGAVAAIEPLVVPADPGESGAPVGVQTHEVGGVTVEVWYPAPDAVEGQPTDPISLADYVPASVTSVLGSDLPLGSWDSGAVRDAGVRDAGAAYPVVVFSHGFGAFRTQSTDLTVHLASRGYIVVAADHPGRMLGDVLPCLFSPALEGCDLSGFGVDPAPDDIRVALAWLEDGAPGSDLGPHLDLDRLGLFGHSAGGGTTATLGQVDDRFDVLVPMAGAGPITRDVPVVVLDATCDGVVPVSSTTAAASGSTDATLVHLQGAGHLAFADLCAIDLGALAADVLAPRDDINETLLPQLTALGTDGCPGYQPSVDRPECADQWLDLDVSAPIIRHLIAATFDTHLKGTGPGIDAASFPEIEVVPGG